MLFKDEPKVNHRNEKDYEWGFSQIVKILNESNEGTKDLFTALLGNENLKELNTHHPEHNACNYDIKKDSSKLTEKRICRCMFYYGKNKEKCKNCTLCKKWKNVGSISVEDYEKPTFHVISKVGGIDLILKDKSTEYAVEVKPEKSGESLTRMIAEILTYTQDCDKTQDCNKSYTPAICFFEGSKQMNDFNKYKNNKDFKRIMEVIKVFYIKTSNIKNICEYQIIPIVDNI